MIAKNQTNQPSCQKLLIAFFEKYPNPGLQGKLDWTLKRLLESKTPMPGKSGGWAGGIVYATANCYKSACGIPGLLNSECEEFFSVSMSTIYKRAWMIQRLLLDI